MAANENAEAPLGEVEKNPVVNDGSIASEQNQIDARALFKERLCLKLDWHILTPMFLLNVLSLMGRTNIGAAYIQELPADLKLTAMKEFLATTIPLVMLIVFEVPSNILMKWLEVKFNLPYMRYLCIITFCLGE